MNNLIPVLLLLLLNCSQSMNEHTTPTSTNRLANETSPYLQQHATNPVDWYPWGPEALNKAKEENKPILLSIGYSSCHWCHVMAHESFENDTIAAIMNEHFINIKLDREERPDIDQIYMDAVQTMGLRGGWPLNVFLTPDQKPFYGGTYFPPTQWAKLLRGIDDAYTNNYDKLYESATKFAENLQLSEAKKYGLGANPLSITKEEIDNAFTQMTGSFDSTWGGMQKAPKFPMPSIWQFLASYYFLSGSEQAKDHFLFTLDKMAEGGIYDQIGGGFARYSVDGEWHVPHFEKMLYDNGQLLSLYANGYKISGEKKYMEVMTGIAQWLQREMLDESGGFYSALDADSEGEEGKFYVWSMDEIKALAGDDFSIIAEYYDVSRDGNWEGKNVLRRLESDQDFVDELNLSQEDLERIVSRFNDKALQAREKRIRPGLDNKIISGWNGLVLTGLSEAYQASGDQLFLDLAKTNAAFIRRELINENVLLRIKGLKTKGYMEDYAAVIKGFIDYYETVFDEKYLQLADTLTNVAMEEFYDEKEALFYFTSNKAEDLIARKKELFDNVIPSSNSIMANNLYRLGIMLDKPLYQRTAEEMILQVNPLIKQEPEYLSNWAITSIMMLKPTAEVLVVGPEASGLALDIQKSFLPNKVIMATESGSKLPLFEHKDTNNGKTTVFVCFDKTCKRPVFSANEAISEIVNLN